MKQIPLAQDKYALVDDEDYTYLIKFKWLVAYRTSSTYAVSSRGRLMHREIMCASKGTVVDHKNGNGLDNRRINLRIGTQAQNTYNRGPDKNKRNSKWKGVYLHKSSGRWGGRINFNLKTYSLGYFDLEEDCAMAYNDKAAELHGEYAYYNVSTLNH